jgi:hypothetical protein
MNPRFGDLVGKNVLNLSPTHTVGISTARPVADVWIVSTVSDA